MANETTGKFWVLDTAGVVSDTQVKIKKVSVTWKVSSAGALEINEVDREDGPGSPIVYAKTLGATSAAGDALTQDFIIDDICHGLYVKTITNIDKLVVQVG